MDEEHDMEEHDMDYKHNIDEALIQQIQTFPYSTSIFSSPTS